MLTQNFKKSVVNSPDDSSVDEEQFADLSEKQKKSAILLKKVTNLNEKLHPKDATSLNYKLETEFRKGLWSDIKLQGKITSLKHELWIKTKEEFAANYTEEYKTTDNPLKHK